MLASNIKLFGQWLGGLGGSGGSNPLFVEPPAGTEASDLFAALRSKGILVRYFPGERTGNCLRITIGTDAEMDAFLAAL